jgi:OPT family oligopeptide transporter
MSVADTAAGAEAVPAAPPRELTARALLFGAVTGAVLAAGNVYTGLKTGFIDGGGITAALLGFAFFATFRRFSPASFGPRENNIAQTTASSAAIMGFCAGCAGPLPSLSLMGRTFSPWPLVAWGIAVGGLGILVGSTLRHKLVRTERLPFPTGAATAEVIETMSAARETALRRAILLMLTAVLAMAFAWFRDGRPALLPQTTMFGGAFFGVALSSITVGVSWSPLMVSTGMLMGERASVSMLAGGVVGWIILAPRIVSEGLVAQASFGACNGWLIWPGVGMLLAGSFVPLLLDWRGIVRSFRDLAGLVPGRGANLAALDESERFPWAKALLPLFVAIMLVVATRVFQVGAGAIMLGVVLAVVLANVCARTAGETDMAPTGAVGTLAQLALAGGGVVGSMIGGGVVAGSASQTSQTLWSFKTGERLGGSPRAQLWAQLIGAVIGSAVAVPTYFVIVRAYAVGTEAMPAPSALSWKATAEAVQHGIAAMPRYAPAAGAIGFCLGILLAALGRTRFARFVPSPAAMGVGIITPFTISSTAVIGGVIIFVMKRLRPSASSEATLMAIAAGGIAGESVMGVIIAALIASGILSPS